MKCVDKYGNTPLHSAAKHGHELLISLLLNNGGDVARCVFTKPFKHKGYCGRTDTLECVSTFFVSPLADVKKNAFTCFGQTQRKSEKKT